MIRAYFTELLRPTRFEGYAATANQLGHVVLGSALGWVAALFLPQLMAVAVVLIGYALFELWQGGERKDALADLLFVGLGAFMASSLAPIALVLAGLHGILTMRLAR